MYLNTKKKSHIWISGKSDTACKMWSTGGIRKNYTPEDVATNLTCEQCLIAKVKSDSKTVKIAKRELSTKKTAKEKAAFQEAYRLTQQDIFIIAEDALYSIAAYGEGDISLLASDAINDISKIRDRFRAIYSIR